MAFNNEFGLIAPAEHAETVTSSDVNPVPHPTRAVYVGVTGDLEVRMIGGETVTLVGVAAGILHPLQVIYILSGTTATDIVIFW